MKINDEILANFFNYASQYLKTDVRKVTIVEGGQLVPKLDELTTDYVQYSHLFEYWETLKRSAQ